MALGYILRQDIETHLSDTTLDELTGGKKAIGTNPAVQGTDRIWQALVSPSMEKMLGYTRHWYNMDVEVRGFVEYSNTATYVVNQRVASTEDSNGNRRLFRAKVAVPAGTPLAENEFFAEEDDRNSVLVEIVVILIIYSLSRRLNPRQIPEQRQIDYDNAMKMLRDIQMGKMQLKIAERTNVADDDPGQEVAFGEFEDLTLDDY